MQQAHKKRPGDMLMGLGGGSSTLAAFSKIDNQALIMFISLPGESFARHHVALSFADWTDAKQPDQSGADHVRTILAFLFTPPSKTVALAASAAPDTAGHRPNACLPSRNRASRRWWRPRESARAPRSSESPRRAEAEVEVPFCRPATATEGAAHY